MPTSNGTNGQYLQTDGSGNLSFATITTPTQGNFQNTIYSTPGTYTWTAPTGVTSVRVTVFGAGAGGATATYGGGSGGSAVGIYTVTPGTGYTVTVGAASASAATTTAGGSSSFGSLISATGGGGASGSNGTAGVGSSGNIANSYSNTYAAVGTLLQYFKSSYQTYFDTTGSTSAKTWSPTASATNTMQAGMGGTAGSGGVGGIVFIEYVG